MTTDEILGRFGGVAAVAALLSCRKNAVHNWKRAGIPAKFWHVLATEAESRGFHEVTIAAISGARLGSVSDQATAA